MMTAMMGVLALLLSAVSWPSLACRALGGGPPRPRPQLAALAPAATIPAVAAVPLAAARSWRLALALAVPAAVLVGWQLPPRRNGGRGAGEPGPELRILAINIEAGKASPEHLIGVLSAVAADVLVAAEVTPEAVDRLAEAGLHGMLPYSVVEARPGHTGTAIWSRWPLDAASPIPGLVSIAPRAVLQLGGQLVTLTGVHVMAPLHDRERRWAHELGLLASVAGPAGRPALMAGDFNATRDHRPFRDLLAAGYVDSADMARHRQWPALTWPSDHRGRPVMRLDHVLASREDFTVAESRTMPVDGTDHRAVLAVLRLRGRAGPGR